MIMNIFSIFSSKEIEKSKNSRSMQKSMAKIFVLDTNVLLHDPKALFAFEDNEIIIPLAVLDELDKKKNGSDEVARHARMVIRSLDALRTQGNIHEGVVNDKGGFLRVELNFHDKCPVGLDPARIDNRLMGVVIGLTEQSNGRKVKLITKDINLRVKCDALGIESEDYIADSVAENADAIYSGTKEITVNNSIIDQFYKDDGIDAKDFGNFYANQYVLLKSYESTKKSALARFEKGKLVKIKTFNDIWGIISRNKEQAYALDALFNPNIKLVTLIGKSGCGKTLLSAAAGVSQIFDTHSYKRIIMSRPVQPLGKQDIGFLPGPQPLDCKILTPNGWTTMGKLNIGDEIIARDGSKSKVLGIYPKGKKSVYKITTNNGSTTRCCEDHLWYTQTKEDIKRNIKGSIKNTKEIIQTLRTKNGKLNHYLPRNDESQFNSQELPISPYVLGAILGDGHVGEAISIANTDKEIIDRISNEIQSLDCHLSNSGNNINYYFVRNNSYVNKAAKKVKIIDKETREINTFDSCKDAEKQLGINRCTIFSRCEKSNIIDNSCYEWIEEDKRYLNPIKENLRKLGLEHKLANTKFIPDIYKYSRIQDRLDILRGLMDTDGTVKDNGEASFCTVSERLAKDVVEIIKSLGGRANIRKRNRATKDLIYSMKNIISKKEIYEFNVSLPNKFNPFFISRKAKKYNKNFIYREKIESIKYIGEDEVQCILIDNPEHLYITDDFIVTHNTIDEKMSPWMSPLQDNLDLIFSEKGSSFLDIQKEAGLIQVEALSYIRGRSLGKSFVIIDESQNLSKHELKTIITRIGEESKIVLTGDIMQIDTTYLDSVNNGLSWVIEKFKDYPIAAHVTLTKGERSELATLASEIL